MMDRIKKIFNSFYGQIMLLVLFGVGLMAVLVSILVIFMSKRAFIETYAESQEKVFGQIAEDLNAFHSELQNISGSVDSSWAFRLYLSERSDMSNIQTFQNIYQMERDFEESKATDMDRLNFLVLGTNGKHYLSRTETISVSDDDIWKSIPVKRAVTDPEVLHYCYSHGAYTSTTQNVDVLVVSKALLFPESRELYGVVLITLTMEDLKRFYDYFVTDITSFYLIDDDKTVLCSDDTPTIGKALDKPWIKIDPDASTHYLYDDNINNLTVLHRPLEYSGCEIYGVIDNDKALADSYNIPALVLLCIVLGMVIMISCVILMSKTMKPLSVLVKRMSKVREGDFAEHMNVAGTEEVREVVRTYNYMLDDIRRYIDELLETQAAQRKAEIRALQMQINPHYIYNTLASIKWLVYQNDKDKTVATIDAFISLLRNTISNDEEYITVSQEVENLKNYCLINKTRYGDAVNTEFYISQSCNDCLVPKMMIQPFIENAFFHAFPDGQFGTIQVYITTQAENIEIKIVDDGVGMDITELDQIDKKTKEHFTGIGINNVEDRLHLLYGKEYGINISSAIGQGTVVTITIPKRTV